jgi:hypothetical protein
LLIEASSFVFEIFTCALPPESTRPPAVLRVVPEGLHKGAPKDLAVVGSCQEAARHQVVEVEAQTRSSKIDA